MIKKETILEAVWCLLLSMYILLIALGIMKQLDFHPFNQFLICMGIGMLIGLIRPSK